MSETTDAVQNVNAAEPIREKAPFLPFGEVWAEMKSPSKFLSLEGSASIAKYWTVFLMVTLPLSGLALLLSWATRSCVSSGSGFASTLLASYTVIALFAAALSMLPVMVRRARAIGLPTCCAAVVFGVSLLAIPHIVWLVPVLLIALGAIPEKTVAKEVVAAKYNPPFWGLWCIALAGLCSLFLRIAVAYVEHEAEKGKAEIQKEMQKMNDEMRKMNDEMRKSFSRWQ